MRQRSMFTGIALTAAGTATLLSCGGGASATGVADAASTTSGPGVTITGAAGTAVGPGRTAAGASSLAAAGVTSRQAVQIARGKVPGARVTRVRRVWDQGIWNWRVELVKAPWRYDLFVSVRSGRVVRIKINYGH
ncbi:PepSY domain-containing protein [Planomonospora parontospora]|uniref:PepSY domain-containing protein n=1 Tax=Planomonospora parontospora TaxID=58119 RepID=UPI0016707CB8|nr:PepSY domain-containing protein [Planomonospora parontospora]